MSGQRTAAVGRRAGGEARHPGRGEGPTPQNPLPRGGRGWRAAGEPGEGRHPAGL